MEKACLFYGNHVIPQDAQLLHTLYQKQNEQTGEPDWNKIHSLLPKFLKGPIPIAILESGTYVLRGICKAKVEILNGNIHDAIKALVQDLSSALKCLAFVVASVGYAVLGLFSGSAIYPKIDPQPLPQAVTEEMDARLHELTQQKNAAEARVKELEKIDDRVICQEGLLGVQKAELAEKTKEIASLQERIQNLEQLLTSNARLKEEKEVLEDINKTLQAENKTYIEGFNNILKQKAASDKVLNDQIKGLEEEINHLKQSNEDNKATLSKKFTKIADLRTELARLDSERDLMIQEKEAFYQEESNLKQELTESEQAYLESVNAYEALEHEHKKLVAAFIKLSKAHGEDLTQSMRLVLNQYAPEENEQKAELEKSFIMVDNAAPNSSSAQPSQFYGFYIHAATAVTGTMNDYILQPAIKAFNDNFVDGKDPWKDQRYIIIIEQLQKLFGPKEIEALRSLQDIPGNKGKEILMHLKTAMNILSKPANSRNVRAQRKTFITALRKVLDILQNDSKHDIPQDLQDRLNALCAQWMTSLEMNPFNFQLALYVASKGDPQIVNIINNPQSTLHDMLDGLFKGIKAANPSFKAPKIDLDAAKGRVLLPSFDAILNGNMPSKVCDMVYESKNCNIRNIREYRTGVPISYGKKPSPEFIGLLNHLKAKNKLIVQQANLLEGEARTKKLLEKEKLLVFLHLDPHFYNPITHELQIDHTVDKLLQADKIAEASWIKPLHEMSLSEEYKDVMSLALLPMDGAWLKKIEECSEGMTVAQIEKHILDAAANPNGPFIIPSTLLSIQRTRENFIKEVLKVTIEMYFNSELLNTLYEGTYDEKSTKLNKDMLLAFVGNFNSLLMEGLQIIEGATIVQANCKDGVDRTGAEEYAKLTERHHRLGVLSEKENQKKILGATAGPPLGVLKREFLGKRQPLALAVAKYFDQLLKHQIVPKELIYYGYKLKSISIGEDATQQLYPHLSNAATEEQYQQYIQVELDYPFSTPKQFAMKPLTEVEAKQISSNVNRSALLNLLREPTEHLRLHYNNDSLAHIVTFSEEDDIKHTLVGSILRVASSYKIYNTNITLEATVTVDLSKNPAVPQFEYKTVKA